MKAKRYDGITTLVDIQANFGKRLIPKGTEGSIVECYKNPEGYAVDLAIPDESSVTGYDYENVILYPEQFTVSSPIIETELPINPELSTHLDELKEECEKYIFLLERLKLAYLTDARKKDSLAELTDSVRHLHVHTEQLPKRIEDEILALPEMAE